MPGLPEKFNPLRKLVNAPSLTDIQNFLHEARFHPSIKLSVVWKTGPSEFTLTVVSRANDSDGEWQLNNGFGPSAKKLWMYVSSDCEHIYKMLLASLESSAAAANAANASASTNARTGGLGLGMGRSQAPPPAAPSTPNNPGRFQENRPTTSPGIPISAPLSQSAPGFGFQESRATIPPSSPQPASANFLSGSLTAVPAANLLQSISLSRMTGRLRIDTSNGPAEVFFLDGAPCHAQMGSEVGSEVLLELVGWTSGNFQFEPKLKTEESTISQNLDSLLLQAAQLIDNAQFLQLSGITLTVPLVRARVLTEAGFEEALKAGAPLDLVLQKRLYRAIDGVSTLEEILLKLGLKRSQWTPIAANLLRCNLIAATAQIPKQVISIQPRGIDQTSIDAVRKSLCTPQDGILTQAAFLYFLELEAFRQSTYQLPYSVVILEMKIERPGLMGQSTPLTPQLNLEIVKTINAAKRPTDVLGHYDRYGIALLLTNTKGVDAAVFARKLAPQLLSVVNASGLEKGSVRMGIGISSAPQDYVDYPFVLAAAEKSRDYALESGELVILFRNLRSAYTEQK
jgi:hypothetical protein